MELIYPPASENVPPATVKFPAVDVQFPGPEKSLSVVFVINSVWAIVDLALFA